MRKQRRRIWPALRVDREYFCWDCAEWLYGAEVVQAVARGQGRCDSLGNGLVLLSFGVEQLQGRFCEWCGDELWEEGMESETQQGLQALMNWIGTRGGDAGVFMNALMVVILTWQKVRRGQGVVDEELGEAVGHVWFLRAVLLEVGLIDMVRALDRLYITLEVIWRGGAINE